MEQALGDSEGQGSLACCSPWGSKELDITEGLINDQSVKYKAIKFLEDNIQENLIDLSTLSFFLDQSGQKFINFVYLFKDKLGVITVLYFKKMIKTQSRRKSIIIKYISLNTMLFEILFGK